MTVKLLEVLCAAEPELPAGLARSVAEIAGREAREVSATVPSEGGLTIEECIAIGWLRGFSRAADLRVRKRASR